MGVSAVAWPLASPPSFFSADLEAGGAAGSAEGGGGPRTVSAAGVLRALSSARISGSIPVTEARAFG